MNGLGIRDWDIVYNPNLMYSFRDNVLTKSERGRIYIDNYYYLSKEWKGKITIETGMKTAIVLKDFNPVMRAFLEPDVNRDKVMFTASLSNSLLNLLNEYQTITTSAQGKEMLNSIRADINVLRNKTLGEIIAGLENNEIPVEKVTLDKSMLTLKVNEKATLIATVSPSNANQAVKWESSNPSVATVMETGLVTGITKGAATITVTTQNGNKTANCHIRVIE